MKIKVWYYNFWSHFKLLKRSFIQVLEEDGYEFIIDEKNPDIVFINSFGPITYNGPAIKIGYVTEDMNRFTGIFRKIQEKTYFDMVIGNLPNIKSSKFCKHPLYIDSTNHRKLSKEKMIGVNKLVKNKDLSNLKFCSIVASHDMYGNRMPIINLLSKIDFVECPGKLNNNVPSFDDEGLSKEEYISNFIFNICPENHLGHEGYTSEKITDCINSGCIPIYYGRTNDSQDIQIFNQNRIIRYDPSSKEVMNNCYNQIKELMEDPNKLKKFYEQPPYYIKGEIVIENLFNDLKKKFKKIIKNKLQNNN
jgi:hypothetical protein